MKRILALISLAALLLCLLSGCGGSSTVTADEAQDIALKDAGLKASEVDDVHTHLLTTDRIPSYSIHITVGDTEYEYVISAKGEILSSDIHN